MFGYGSLMSSRDGVRCVNSWEFQSRTSHFQECKFSTYLSKISNMKYRNDTQSIRRRQVQRGLYGGSLWVGYLGLGAGSLYLLSNPQKVTGLFCIVSRRITGILGWSSWGGLSVYFVICVINHVILLLSENMFVLDRGWVRISISSNHQCRPYKSLPNNRGKHYLSMYGPGNSQVFNGIYYHRASFAKSLLLDFLTGRSPLFFNIWVVRSV